MKQKPVLAWIVANALGLGLGFDAMLMPAFMESGVAPDDPSIPTPALWDLASTVVLWGVGGLVLGGAQALVLISHSLHLGRWVLATTVGFGAAALTIACPLQAAGILGRIPGPAEPIMFTVGGCIGAGIFQSLLLRRRNHPTGRWLRLWVAGLFLSLVPTVLMFFVLQAVLGLELVWPVEVFLNGFMCAGVAAWISGRALFSALTQAPASEVIKEAAG
ncbi:MAG: hypothetical protein PVI86_10150 [Phycisphaerae bacterium]|jgi:uncharacterized membrane protein